MSIVDEISALISVAVILAAVVFYIIGYKAGKADTEYRYRYSGKKKRSYVGEIVKSYTDEPTAMFKDDSGKEFYSFMPFDANIGDKAMVTFEIIDE